jgi:methyltransferase-like protein
MRPVNAKPELGPQVIEEFRGANGAVMRTGCTITKAAASILAERWPKAVSFAELVRDAALILGRAGAAAAVGDDDAKILSSDLLQCYGSGLVQLHAMPSPFVTRLGERPRGSPLAREQARHNRRVTNLRHETVNIDPNVAGLLQLLDGTQRPHDIEQALVDLAISEPGVTKASRKEVATFVRERLPEALRQLARSALLVG